MTSDATGRGRLRQFSCLRRLPPGLGLLPGLGLPPGLGLLTGLGSLTGLGLLCGLARVVPALAQPAPPPDPLPTVVYPFTVPDNAPRPAAPPVPEANGAGPIRYVLVDGVWGYWDRAHRFHPRPVSVTRGPDRPPDATVPVNQGGPPPGLPPVTRGETTVAEIHRAPPRPAAPRTAAALPNQRPDGIVVHSAVPRDRDQTR